MAFLPAALLLVFSSAAGAEKPLESVRAEEYRELADQISRLRTASPDRRERLRAEALDPQALIVPADRDPLDVVLRRTAALLGHFRKSGALAPEFLSEQEAALAVLSVSAKTAREDGERRTLFSTACELRRKIAFANPLLDFDAIACMLEQPGEQRIIEQARAVWGGHSVGGGPPSITTGS
jgi:hypothetical protein